MTPITTLAIALAIAALAPFSVTLMIRLARPNSVTT
jgi:hypothetical protein